MKYQELILDTLETIARKIQLPNHDPSLRHPTCSRVMRLPDTGRLIVHDPKDLSTLATFDFAFQDASVHGSINTCAKPCEPLHLSRRDGIYRWTAGRPDDDHELVRLTSDWKAAITERAHPS